MSSSIITQTTVFNPALKTLDFSAWTAPAFDPRKLLAVINKSQNPDVIMYRVLGGTGLEGTFTTNIVTLDLDTTSFNASDILEIHYGDDATATLQSQQNTLIGAVNETVPTNDTDSSGINGRLQRIAQNITTLISRIPLSLGQKAKDSSLAVTLSTEDIAVLGSPFQAGGSIGNTSFIANAGTNLNTSALALEATQSTLVTNLGSPFQAGGNIGNTSFKAQLQDNAGTPVTLGQKVALSSIPVVLASDQSSIPTTSTLNAETNKVIGVVRNSDGTGNLLSSTGNALDINIKSGSIGNTSFTVNNANGASAVNIQDGGNSITVDASALPLPAGASTSALQTSGNTSLSNINVNLGSISDVVAPNDTGNFSIIAFIKRALQNWTSLLTDKVIIGQSAQTAIVSNILNNPSSGVWTDCSGYCSAKVAIVGGANAAGRLIFEGSMNASTAFDIVTYRSDLKEGGKIGLFPSEDLNIGGISTFDIPINFPFIRLRIADTLGASIQATITLKRSEFNPKQEGDNYHFGTAQSAVTSNILTRTTLALPFLDCSGFNSAMVQIKSTGTGGTFRFTASNYETDFNPIPVYNQSTGQLIASPITAVPFTTSYKFPIEFINYRLEIVTPITGGAIQAFTRLSTKPFSATKPKEISPWNASVLLGSLIGNSTLVKSAPASGLKNYITSIQIVGTNTGVIVGIALISNGVSIWQGVLPVGLASTPMIINAIFDTPIAGEVATSITCSKVTPGTVTGIAAAGNLMLNVQGYISS
jgi:hypothetical protein